MIPNYDYEIEKRYHPENFEEEVELDAKENSDKASKKKNK